MIETILALVVALTLPSVAFSASVLLKADGHTDTYALINRTLGGSAVETPDCSHPAFGPHIRQELDNDLGKHSFVFYLHTAQDNDRCIMLDRQRNEIKTYGKSSDYLKGFKGSTVTYRWKFRLDGAFLPSTDFTHIHQIKAGDGDAEMPIVTLTPRAGKTEQLELIHVDSTGARQVISNRELAPLKGVWVEAYEKITYAKNGSYSLGLRRLRDGAELLTYSNANIDMWRADTTFVRPKWGIYRSLKHAEHLRDEAVRFDDFCLAKGPDDCLPLSQMNPVKK